MSAVSIHLANTVSGEYDVKLPLPKPLHCDRFSGEITRPIPGNDFDQVVGFTADLASFTLDLTWSEWVTEPLDPRPVVGMFPVVVEHGQFVTLPLPVRQVSVDGKPLEVATEPKSDPVDDLHISNHVAGFMQRLRAHHANLDAATAHFAGVGA